MSDTDGRERYANPPRLPEGETVDIRSLFDGGEAKGPIELEIGPGRGAFIMERSAAAPEMRLLGLEIRRKWAQRVDERLARMSLAHRARVLCEDAKVALPRLTPDASVQRVHILFPDPWWKKRHQKRLVIVDPLIAQVVRLLADDGELFVQTDVPERFELYQTVIGASEELVPDGDEDGSPVIADNPYNAMTNRERHAATDGLPVYRMRFRRRPRG